MDGSETETLSTLLRSLLRADVGRVRSRSRLVFTAAASIGVPSANLIPLRSLIVTVLPSAEVCGMSAASCGTISSFALMS